MTRSRGTEINRVLEIVVGEINSSSELQDGGPPVVLTLGGSVLSGTIIPDWHARPPEIAEPQVTGSG